ncbi:hypothetical protein ACIGO8_02810 [Streptomyces sp. NPDC053493]|uniref:hypothetical protein n=1 Tax=Streptomyces sp. NPDC053493 TaxID=3365705 RepID=UPI0037D7B288
MNTPHGPGSFVAHTGTDVYGPGKVIGVDGVHRRVRFVHFVATVRACDLRAASAREAKEVQEWLRAKKRRYGGEW